MTEQELRVLVRTAIAGLAAEDRAGGTGPFPAHPRTFAPSHHMSHQLLVLPAGSDTDGPCLIEPAVMCNHCGYCKSYGH